MKLSSIISYILVILIILIVSIPSIYTVIDRHKTRLKYVTENKIIDIAKRCYYEEKCQNNKIILKDLYDQNLLEKIANPLTHEYYNENSYVAIENETIIFVEVKN